MKSITAKFTGKFTQSLQWKVYKYAVEKQIKELKK